MMSLSPIAIETKIYNVRGHKVMLDVDLADLYGVETKRLNEQVRRNPDRFPSDFMFQLSPEERDQLLAQMPAENPILGRKYLPYAFTENGVAMLSSVLNSQSAIQVNIAIIRIFTKLRSFLLLEQEMRSRMESIEEGTDEAFQLVFERLDRLERREPALPLRRKRIGL